MPTCQPKEHINPVKLEEPGALVFVIEALLS